MRVTKATISFGVLPLLAVGAWTALAQEPETTSETQFTITVPCTNATSEGGDIVCTLPDEFQPDPIVIPSLDPTLAERYPGNLCESYTPPERGLAGIADNIRPQERVDLRELLNGGQRYAYSMRASLAYNRELAAFSKWEKDCRPQVCEWVASLDPITLTDGGTWLATPPDCDNS